MALFILASASPRRRAFLSALLSDGFLCEPSSAEESLPSCHWSEVALRGALAKAEDISKRHPEGLTLGADTVIEIDGRILGKPRDLADAKEMLLSLSGRTHCVATGVCLKSLSPRRDCMFVERSFVSFKRLSALDVEGYLSKVHVLDKAGSYAIQEHGDMIVESISGDFDNIVGLPSARVAQAIAACGFASLLKARPL